MTWGLVAVGVGSVISGAASASAANKKAGATELQGLKDEANSLSDNLATNQAIAAANLQNTIRTGYKVGILNVQRGMAKKDLIEKGINVHKAVSQALGAATANQAASGTIGSSADAVLNDIKREGGETILKLDNQADTQDFNFATMLTDLVNQGQDALQSGKQVNTAETPQQARVGMGEVMVGAAANVVSAYGNQKLSLGLGKS